MQLAKNKLSWWTVGKWFVGIFFFFFLFKSFEKQELILHDIIKYFSVESKGVPYFLLILFLIPVNWGIEAFKWRFLLKNFFDLSFSEGLKAVLAGLTISMVIPNRMGEYAGRIAFLPANFRVDGVLLTLVGSFAQTTITVLVGIWCGFIYLYAHNHLYNWGLYSTLLLLVVVSIIWLYLYFNIRKIIYFIPSFKYAKKVIRFVKALFLVSKKTLLITLFFAFVRYIVFSLQMALAFQFFGVDIPFQILVLSIPLIFFVQTVVPGTILTDLGIRGSAALFFLGNYAPNALLLASGLLIWLLNLVIPSILGFIFLAKQRISTN